MSEEYQEPEFYENHEDCVETFDQLNLKEPEVNLYNLEK